MTVAKQRGAPAIALTSALTNIATPKSMQSMTYDCEGKKTGCWKLLGARLKETRTELRNKGKRVKLPK